MTDMAGKVAFVTGGSRGIGRAICHTLSKRGATVAVGWGGSEAAAQETLQCLVTAGSSLVKCDVGAPVECSAAIGAVIERHGRIDILINNAGVTFDSLLVRQSDESFERTIAVNLQGPFSLLRAAARPMMKQRSGVVVNVSSVIGEMGNAGQAAYAASKAGLIGLTKSAAKELGGRNIRVNCVTPGYIETDMTAMMPEAARTKLLELVPLGILGAPSHVAEAVAFLASDAAAYITGAVLKVNGGLYM